jgi:tetratricopeptide (TPR) repeat protein
MTGRGREWIPGVLCAGLALSVALPLVAGQSAPAPKPSQAPREQALELMQAGKLDEAERVLLRELARDPGRDELLLDLAKLHIRGRSFEEAERNLQEYLRAHPDTPLALGLAGEVKFREKDFQGATAYLRRMLALRPDDGIAHKLLALCYGAENRWDEALPHLNRAVTLLPGDEESHYWLGRCLLEGGHYQQAVEEFQETLRIRPDFLKAYDNLGLCYDRLSKYDLAIANYRRAVELDQKLGTHYIWPYVNLGSLLNHLRRYAEAVELLKPVATWAPSSAAVHYHLGRARLGLEELDPAEADLLKASQLDPALALPHYQLARLYKQLGKPEEARRQLAIFSKLAKPSEGNRSLY